jgi:Adenylate and Guanylate cyclase catalytic domain
MCARLSMGGRSHWSFTPYTRGVVWKVVTVLFADVTGSTRLGERLDPEALRRVMTRYFEVSRATLERHGGTVEKFSGDAVMAVFGIPAVHDDDALRAVRAALELRRAVAGLGIELRIGINTGESDDDLPGVDADPQPKTSPKQLLESPPHREGRFERSLGVVLLGGGRTEHGHDGVAGELLDSPAGLPDFRRHGFVEAVEERSRAFGVLGVRKGGGADEVSEKDGRQLAFDAARGRLDRLSARGAEPRCGGNRGAALETCRHGMHSSATYALVPERERRAAIPQ